jgi:hypothetical protein
MRLNSIPVAAGFILLIAVTSGHAQAQCLENHYVSDGAPSSQRDCQPMTTLIQVSPEQMSPAAQSLLASRHADLVRAASFYGYDLNAPGWTFQQSVSPILQKHVLLSFTHAEPKSEASHFVAVVPADNSELVQVVPAFAHGLRLFEPGWQKKGTYSVFNRLLKSEEPGPITVNSEWIDLGSLYIALTGAAPAVPTDSDSVKASWDLTAKRATTPVISIRKDGGAIIAVSDISDPTRSTSWKLVFDKHGQIEKAEQASFAPEKVLTMETAKGSGEAPPLPHSPLNPQ